jgi:hypothetical protein
MNSEWCKRCGECCKGNIIISGLEALWLVGRAMTNNGIGCPFLQKDTSILGYKCSVYDCRPIVCREYGPAKTKGEPEVMSGLVKFGTCKHYIGPDVPANETMVSAAQGLIDQSGMVELSTDRKPGDKSVGRFKLAPDSSGNAMLIADPDYCGDKILVRALTE